MAWVVDTCLRIEVMRVRPETSRATGNDVTERPVHAHGFFIGRCEAAVAVCAKALGETFWLPCFGMLNHRFDVGSMVIVPGTPP